MGIVTGMTSEAMRAIADASVVDGAVNPSGSLILSTRGGVTIDAGNVRGPQGNTGVAGTNGGTAAARDQIYGVPTTEAARLALALRQAIWWNSDRKWFETYTVPANFVNKPSTLPAGYSPTAGWFPVPMPLGFLGEVLTLPSTGSRADAWFVADRIQAELILGRRYRVNYRFTSLGGEPDIALAFGLWFSAGTTNVSTLQTTELLRPHTVYTAPKTNQGKTDAVSWTFTAPASAVGLLKINCTRAAGASTFSLSSRELTIYDEGAR